MKVLNKIVLASLVALAFSGCAKKSVRHYYV